jgi:hypothetical protein
LDDEKASLITVAQTEVILGYLVVINGLIGFGVIGFQRRGRQCSEKPGA